MLGDEAQPDEGDGARAKATPGPRHAAPRKSLLTKMHVPAGKAVALAAMPTAVLMGMGFTPHLAQADEPKTPFKPGPCVTQSDSPSDSGKDAAGAKGDQPTPTTSPSASAPAKGDQPNPSASPSAPTHKATTKPTPATSSPSPSATPKPSPTSSTPDLLGLGGLLNGLLGGGSSTPAPAPTTKAPTPAPTTTAPKADPTPSGSPSASGGDSGKGAGDVLKKVTKALTDTAGTPSPSATGKAASGPSTDASGDPKAYPCPAYDAKALAAADVETGIPLLPDAPWTLKSSRLTLRGLQYHGIVKVRTWNGTVKDVLKFTAGQVDIGDLDQFVEGPNNSHTEVRAAAGSTSTIRNGTVTMYTESLSGNLLGLIPITFSPKAPPPLTLPETFFTGVTVVQAGQFGGDLHVPGMQVMPNKP